MNPSFFAVIPAHVRYSKNLEPNAKLLYGELTALTSHEGYCWATNEYFAELFDVDISTIKRWLRSLKKEKFIVVEVKKEGMQTSRKIWIGPEIKKMFATAHFCPPDGSKMSPKVPPSPYILSNTKEDNTSSLSFRLAQFFFAEIKKINPKIREPNWKKWETEFKKMLDTDNHSEEDIRKVIAYLISTKDKISTNGFSWSNVVLSPAKLRDKFAVLWGEMNTKIAPKVIPMATVVQEEVDLILEHKAYLKMHSPRFRGKIEGGTYETPDFIQFTNEDPDKSSEKIYFKDKKFKDLLLQEALKRKKSDDSQS